MTDQRDRLFKLVFHDADTDTETDILVDILARMFVSVSASASWNASFIVYGKTMDVPWPDFSKSRV